MFPLLKTKRLPIETFKDNISSSVELVLTNTSDQIQRQNFTDGSTTEPPNNSTSAASDDKGEWGQKLGFWSAPVTLGIIALIVICVIMLCIESKRRSFQRQQANNNTPLRNTTPRSRISTTLRATSQENTGWNISSVLPPSDIVTSSDEEDADSKEAPKDVLVTTLAFIEASRSPLSDECKEQTSENMSCSFASSFAHGLEETAVNTTG